MALRQVLERNRVDQSAVADAVGVSRVAVGNWVNGHTGITGTNLVALLAYLQQFEPSLTAADLLTAPGPQIEASK